ncbi:MAG: RNA polymerase sigma factor [Polyangiales bacterium]
MEHTPSESGSSERARANTAMERYAHGDDSAFRELYQILAPRLYGQCIRLAGREQAEELLQEVFLKMHRARASYVSGGSVFAWSFAIARTTQLDRVRAKRRRPEQVVEPVQLEGQNAQRESCPEASFVGRSLGVLLDRRLGRLSESLIAAYALVRVDGLSCAEAGTRLGASVSAVKQRVHRASEDLKAGLLEAGWER